MADPVYFCTNNDCENVEVVRPDGRGFPPDIAKRKLTKRCKADGHECEPKYRVGYYLAPEPGSVLD